MSVDNRSTTNLKVVHISAMRIYIYMPNMNIIRQDDSDDVNDGGQSNSYVILSIVTCDKICDHCILIYSA